MTFLQQINSRNSWRNSFRFLILLAAILWNSTGFGQSNNTNSGTNFWFGYTETEDLQSASYVVYINTLAATNGTVSIPGALWSMNFRAVPGVTTRIVLPSADVVVSSFSAPTNQAVNVVADSNISVFAAIEYSERSDNTCVLPVSLLGNQYFVEDFTLCQSFSQFMIVAQGCKDSVEIIPSHGITVGGNHPAGVPYTEVLLPGQVFLVQSDTDLTGSMVRSLNHSETGVIAGSNWNCVYCNGTANPFYEELYPINTWDKDFVFLPTSQAQDQCRVLSEQNGTVVTFYTNAGNNVQTLNAGQYYDTTVDYSNPVFISGSNPISVGRFLRTGQCNNYYITNPTGKGDPAQVMEDATEQMFLDTIAFYVSRTPDIDSTYIQVVTRAADVNKVFLDNVNIGAFFTTLVPNPTYAYTSLTILPGSHTLTTTGQGFVAYTCGLGFEEAMAADAGVYLQEINLSLSATNPSSCLASDGTATANATGIPPFLYRWNNGETTQTATGLSAGIYTVTVTDSDCVPHKATASIIINGKAGYNATVDDTNPSCADAYGKSTAYPTGGTAPYTYSWNNGQSTQTATGLTAGSYTCTITDNTGCKCFVVAAITTYVPPGIGIAPYNDSSCGPPNEVLHVYGLNTGVYNWAPHTGLSCYQCASPTATPTVTTTYTISGADSNGCTASTTVTLTVLSVPKIIIKGKDSICRGDKDTLIATGGVTYTWTNNGSTDDTIIVSPASTQVYTVTASNGYCPSSDTTFTLHVIPTLSVTITPSQDSVCLGDSVKLNARGASKYRWSTGSTSTSIWVKPPSTKTYTVYAYLGSCSDSVAQQIKVIQPITASIIATKDTICPGGSATLIANAAGGQATYKWSNGAVTSSITVSDSVTTTYTAMIYGLCDSIQKTTTITVIPLPAPVITGADWKCGGQTDTLSVSSSVNPTTYVWNNGATTTTIITGVVNKDTTIWVTAYNSIGCPVKDTLSITVLPPPVVTLNPPTVACSGSPVLLKADAKGTGPFTYSWSPGGQTTDTVTVDPDSVTSYRVIVSNGCNTTETTIVTPDNPTLRACCDNIILIGDDTVIVAHGSSDKYQWSPSVTCLNPLCDSVQVSPTVTTAYTVTLTDTFGCQLERIVTIMVDIRCFDFVVPNVFTPSNAGMVGMDNVFYIKTENMNSWSLVIYDRWGKEMFNSTDPARYWDGNTESGNKAPAGVYYYIISATCPGYTYKKDGFVQLIR